MRFKPIKLHTQINTANTNANNPKTLVDGNICVHQHITIMCPKKMHFQLNANKSIWSKLHTSTVHKSRTVGYYIYGENSEWAVKFC